MSLSCGAPNAFVRIQTRTICKDRDWLFTHRPREPHPRLNVAFDNNFAFVESSRIAYLICNFVSWCIARATKAVSCDDLSGKESLPLIRIDLNEWPISNLIYVSNWRRNHSFDTHDRWISVKTEREKTPPR